MNVLNEQEFARLVFKGKAPKKLPVEDEEKPDRDLQAEHLAKLTGFVEAMQHKNDVDITPIVEAINGMRDAYLTLAEAASTPKVKGRWEFTVERDHHGRMAAVVAVEK